MRFDTLPESIENLFTLIGLYVVARIFKWIFDVVSGISKNKKVDGYRRDTDEYIRRLYEAAASNSLILKECVQLHKNQGSLIQKQTDMLEKYFTNAIEFRVTLNGQMDLMDERLKDIGHRVNEISGKR